MKEELKVDVIYKGTTHRFECTISDEMGLNDVPATVSAIEDCILEITQNDINGIINKRINNSFEDYQNGMITLTELIKALNTINQK
jgi:hypothetical protein